MQPGISIKVIWPIAAGEAMVGGHQFIEPPHLCIGLLKFVELNAAAFNAIANDAPLEESLKRERDAACSILQERGLSVPNGTTKLRQELRECIGNGGYRDGKNEAIHRSSASREVCATAENMARAEGSPHWTAQHLLLALLQGPRPEIAEAFAKAGLKWGDGQKTAGPSSAWPETVAGLINQLRSLRNQLLTRVFGQDHAVHAFIEGLYNTAVSASADAQRTRPQAVFVFAGPPGVGKTFLADLSASCLGRPFKRFDMTGYSDAQAHNQLTGFAASFQSAHPGTLTGFVKTNPGAILLFDEIEKAHLNTLQLFYQILDAGRLEDKFTEENVSFRDTIIVFTTNAGRTLYDHSNRTGICAANANYHRRTILSALENEKSPLTGMPVFPQALCSRLAQGYPVMFNHLGVNELERVCAAEIQRTESMLETQYAHAIHHDQLLPISLVLREGAGADARQLRAESEKFVKNELFKFASLYEAEKIDDVLAAIDRIHFEVDASPEAMEPDVYQLYQPAEKPGVLLICGPAFAECCRENVPEIRWLNASSPDEALDVLSTEDVDLVLLDIWVRRQNSGGDRGRSAAMSQSYDSSQDFVPLSARALTEGRNILHKIHERVPDAPVYLLSFQVDHKPEKGPLPGYRDTVSIDAQHAGHSGLRIGETMFHAVDDELFLACVRAGGARGLVATDFTGVSNDGWTDQRDRFAETLLYSARGLYREKKASALAKERKVLNFETSHHLDKQRRRLVIRLREFRLVRALEAVDAGEIVDDVQRPNTQFEDVIGATEAKSAMQFLVDWLKAPRQYSALGVRPPKGILLTGSPGVGKTLLARAVAGESNCAFIEKSATSFVTVWQGSGPQNVRDLFQRARRYAPAIVFIDEIDAIGRKRGSSWARAEEDTLNALLTEMDGFSAPRQQPVIVLAATNLADQLDPALLRRFDRTIQVDRPDKAARRAYLEQFLCGRKRCAVSHEVIDRMAGQSAGMTVADLERVLHEAAVMAAQLDQDITNALLEEAFEKIRMGEAKPNAEVDTLERTARHEAGHAIVAWLGGNPPVQVTIVGRGNAAGYMERETEENRLVYTKLQIEQRIREAMAGRAAEILCYGPEQGLSTGVAGDLQHATDWACRMVAEFGMSEELGQVNLGTGPEQWRGAGPLAEKVMQTAQAIVKRQLDLALEVLKAHQGLLDRIVGELLDKNRLTGEDLAAIVVSGNPADTR